jgi:hypothetical protein
MDRPSSLLDRTSSSSAKIALFRSLFRGREDIYPRRFESRKTGKTGYAPACANEWVRGICEKPRIKCAECPHRRFLQVTDDVIRWHLSGYDPEGQPFVAGVYPLLQDETCFFVAVDFDKAGWREDATAVLEACRRLNVPVALERSRSGRGAHVWFFFEEAIPATLARRLGSHVLTETMEGRAQTERAVRLKRFFTGVWRRCRRRRGDSASTWRCRSRSMVSDNWKSISSVPMRVSRWSWTAPSISRIRSRIVATVAKINCFRRTTIWCCASLRKMWPRSWTWCSTPY